MIFELDETERLVQKTAREIADKELLPRAAERDRTGAFPVRELRMLGELGLLGVNIPATLGGAEAGPVAYALAMQEIARADASVAVAMAVTNMVGEVICAFGTEEQKQRTVPRITSGAALCGAFALSEPQAGSDPAAMSTSAVRDGDAYVLNGAKQWITSGDRAGVMIVWAKTNKDAGARGISTFLVEREIDGELPVPLAGLSSGRHEDKMGLRGSSTVPLNFEHCRLPMHALLGKEGEGLKVALLALDGGRIGIASQAIGIARAAFLATRAYVKERQQFGRPLADFQAIQHRLADMATEIEAAHLLTLRAAQKKASHRPFSIDASMAKLWASETAYRACDGAVQLHGGYGYSREFPVERYYRDVRVTRIYEGTSEVQRMVISRQPRRARAGVRRATTAVLAVLALARAAIAAPASDDDMGRRVQWLLRAHQTEIYACVQKQTGVVEGEALLRVIVGDGGSAERVEVLKADPKPPVRAAADCVAGVARHWDLLPLGADAGDQVVFPLAFRGDAPGSDAGAIGAHVTLEQVRANSSHSMAVSRVTAFYVLGPGAPRFRESGATVNTAVGSVVLVQAGNVDVIATAAFFAASHRVDERCPGHPGCGRALACAGRAASAAGAGRRRSALLYLDGIAGAPFAVDQLCAKKGSAVPAHQHVGSDEIVYVVSGRVRMHFGSGKDTSDDAFDQTGDLVTIPRGTTHALKIEQDLCAVQVYAPAGPEQRFKRTTP